LFRKKKKRSRTLFEYFNGTRQCRADPLPLWRSLWAHDGFNETLVSDATQGDTEASAALASVLREVFEITPYSKDHEEGLSELEVFDTLADFLLLLEKIKKKRPPLPPKSPPTDSASSTTSPETSSSDSCSAGTT
jgi:hypothetical protein